MKRDDIKFVISHYKKGKFSADKAWQRMNIYPSTSFFYLWKRYGIAVTIAAIVVCSATATLLYQQYFSGINESTDTTTGISPLTEIQIIDFEDTPLIEVIAKIENTYNVTIENLPSNIEDYSLSLHYEGTATELIAVINDILGTQMTVTEL